MYRLQNHKSILVIGGYGTVGSAVCEELARIFDGRIIIAGRSFQQAQRLAARLGERAEPLQMDAAEPGTYKDHLVRTSVVVNCVERNNLEVARQCLVHAVNYVDISASVEILGQLQTLQAEAEHANAKVVLSVGIAPGLTNLLAHHAKAHLGPLERAELFVLLGLGEVHGEDAIRWTLENLGRPFFIMSDGKTREIRSFVEDHATTMPEPFGKRTAYRFNFADQHILPETLGIKSVNTWLCFDSRLATSLLWLLASSRLLSILPLWRSSRFIQRISSWFAWGTTRFVVQVDATGKDGTKGCFSITGDGEARSTGIVAAHVAKRLLMSPGPPGVLHIEELLSLDMLLTELGDRLIFTRT